ncbi:MAG TPA: haloacid dehalogenase-like hydrolase [Gemmatimonadaceae bacterium]|nr:haloacid dehalogenase-like hydrolase [Gemmatimonadaceae bacterium]
MKLVLFDIDGTILWSDGAGRRAMQRALMTAFGCAGSADYRYDGKTDMQIVRDLMRMEGHDDSIIDARMETLLNEYATGLHEELGADATRVHRYDGVLELLDALEARSDRRIGLLTGNIEIGARAKLRAAGIDPDRFSVCAFGSDHEARGELPAIAQRRARERLGLTVDGDAIVIIGDTPADIDCTRGIGARAIAVATGRYSVAELAVHRPVAVFPDLSDTGAVMRAIDDA